MLAFLRVLGVGLTAALVGGLTFAFGSFFVTQLPHENVVRTGIWLPLILLFVELGIRSVRWRRSRHIVLAAWRWPARCSAVHVPFVAMTLLALVMYSAYRAVVGPAAGSAWQRVALGSLGRQPGRRGRARPGSGAVDAAV